MTFELSRGTSNVASLSLYKSTGSGGRGERLELEAGGTRSLCRELTVSSTKIAENKSTKVHNKHMKNNN